MRSVRARTAGRGERKWQLCDGLGRSEDSSFPTLLGAVAASATLVVIAATIFVSRFEPVRVHGESMSPTLADGDLLAVTRRMGAVPRGGIVVIARPDRPTAELVKRIVALPGDPIPCPGPPVVLGPDQYWVVGDNRDASTDSRDFGPVNRCHLHGQALCVYWPPVRWAWLGGAHRSRVLGL